MSGISFLAAVLALIQDPSIPTVRVLIKNAVKEVTLECPGPIELTKPGLSRPVLSLPRLPSTKVTVRDGRLLVEGMPLSEEWITLMIRSSDKPFRIGDRRYAGQLHVVAKERTSFHVVNEVDIETYVYGVIGAEIGNDAPREALKAQAVCARSYALAEAAEAPKGTKRPLFDLYDDTRSQVYVGVPTERSNVRKAVTETAGLGLTYKGRLLKTYFHASCGGTTASVYEWGGDPEIPPLAGVT